MSSTDKNVSFVVVTTNHDAVIETIESIIDSGQEIYYFWEVLVIVNGCDKKFCKKIEDNFSENKNIKTHYFRDGNIGKARNLGIKKAKGEYVIYIDSDCVVNRGYIKRLKKYLNSNFLIARGPIEFSSPQGLIPGASKKLRELAYKKRKQRAYTPNLIVRKDLYDKVGLFDENFRGGEDNEWSLRFEYLEIAIKHFKDLKIKHCGHKSSWDIIKMQFRYGRFRTRMFKKNKLDKDLNFKKKCKIYFRLFDEIPRLNLFSSFKDRIIILFLYLARDLGVIWQLMKR